ncbi:MAG: hypothetical protein Q8R18_04435 [bacterium]|nr:hypothetical protein [bacterium]
MEDIYRWGIGFLMADSRLTSGQTRYLIVQAATMFWDGEEERDLHLKIEGRDDLCLEGRITTKGEPAILGGLVGIQYDAEISLVRGKAKVRFLISEQTGRVFGQATGSSLDDYSN